MLIRRLGVLAVVVGVCAVSRAQTVDLKAETIVFQERVGRGEQEVYGMWSMTLPEGPPAAYRVVVAQYRGEELLAILHDSGVQQATAGGPCASLCGVAGACGGNCTVGLPGSVHHGYCVPWGPCCEEGAEPDCEQGWMCACMVYEIIRLGPQIVMVERGDEISLSVVPGPGVVDRDLEDNAITTTYLP